MTSLFSLSTAKKSLEQVQTPNHSFLNKSVQRKNTEMPRSQSQTFNTFDLGSIRDKAVQKHGTFLNPQDNIFESTKKSLEQDSPSRFFNLKEKINQIGTVKQTTISLMSRDQANRSTTFNLTKSSLPDRLKVDDLALLRNSLDGCSQSQIQNLSMSYVNELVKLQQIIQKNLRQVPGFKTAIV